MRSSFCRTFFLLSALFSWTPVRSFQSQFIRRRYSCYTRLFLPLQLAVQDGNDESEDDMDLNALFQERLEQEGGVGAVTAKAKAKNVARQAKGALGDAKTGLSSSLRPQIDKTVARTKGLQTNGQWDLTLISLGSVVLLAFLLPFVTGTSAPKAAPNVDPAVWGTDGGAAPIDFGRRY